MLSSQLSEPTLLLLHKILYIHNHHKPHCVPSTIKTFHLCPFLTFHILMFTSAPSTLLFPFAPYCNMSIFLAFEQTSQRRWDIRSYTVTCMYCISLPQKSSKTDKLWALSHPLLTCRRLKSITKILTNLPTPSQLGNPIWRLSSPVFLAFSTTLLFTLD